MPLSTDNQDYNNPENKKENQKGGATENKGKDKEGTDSQLTSDNLKGKKVDADLEQESDKPADV